jgi:1-acyl-sn-glycerol-3-phosphate acyltransferase
VAWPSYHWWRTVFYLIPAISIYTVALGTLSIGSSLVDRHGHFAHRCARLWARWILATTGVRVTVEGLDRITPDGTYVFVANHQSIYDIPVVFGSLPHQLRIIAKASLGSFPFLGWHLRRTGHLLVDRRTPDATGVFQWASRLTERGLSLVIFPEGMRTHDGRVVAFKGGSFYPAMRAGLPIVPLSIVGSRHVMRKGELTTRPGHVTLIVHPPIEIPPRTAPRADEVRALAARVREIIRPPVDAEAACGDLPTGGRQAYNDPS